MTFVFCAIAILAFWSLAVSQFVANSLGQKISFMAAVGIASLMGLLTYIDPFYAHDTPERAARLAKAPAMANPFARVLLVGTVMGVLAFEAVNGAVLEFWTLAFGRPAELTMHLGDYNSSSRYSCAGFKLQEAMFATRRVICADYRYDEEPSPGTPVVIRGPASSVGIEVEQFQIGSGD